MDFLEKFAERLDELMFENNLSCVELGKAIGVSDRIINDWKKGKKSILLSNLLNLADYFKCSLEYLVGKTDTKLDYIPHDCPLFYDRLRLIMDKQKITRYRIVKEKIVSENNLYRWKNGAIPYLQTLMSLTAYFNCTLDYLVGRDH